MQTLDLAHYKNRHSLKSKIARVIWNCVWFVLFRPTPRGNIFRPWRIFLLKCFGAKVKWSSNVLPSCRIWQPWNLTMGEYSCLSARVDCYNADEIIIGDQATISQDSFLCTASHDMCSPIMELVTAPITIENQVWVCARAIILPGVTLKEGAVVAAGSVVTKNVDSWTVVGGNPAKPIKRRTLNGQQS
ncbi:MAG: putative colanic acid biosynthesis acetyltransferase [Lentisphaeria bacterium]|nr:putative colanic acid biosynthesis acetyltransferase [Lentisphaeria bacterium]